MCGLGFHYDPLLRLVTVAARIPLIALCVALFDHMVVYFMRNRILYYLVIMGAALLCTWVLHETHSYIFFYQFWLLLDVGGALDG